MPASIRLHRSAAIVAIVAAFALGVTVFWYRHVAKAKAAELPDATEVESMVVSIYGGQFGLPEIENCQVAERHFGTVLECFKPSESSVFARQMMSLPQRGEVRITVKNRPVKRLVFADAGKNSLCFTVDGIAFIRGGQRYTRYREDHRRLYGLDSEAIDEGLSLMYKLIEICTERDPMKEPP